MFLDAADIADEQIAYWQSRDIGADEAWRALGLPWGWGVEWREVRAEMIKWLLGIGELRSGDIRATRRAA